METSGGLLRPCYTLAVIEIEQKFAIKPGDRERLLAGAEFVSKKIIHDAYWDTPNAILISGEAFLRNRDGKFELKIPLHKLTKELPKSYHYDEIYDEAEIRQHLGLTRPGSMPDALRRGGYDVVADFSTTRTKYQRDQFILDFDETDFGFSLVEIERQVERDDQRKVAAKEIVEFAKGMGLELMHVRGKIHEFIKSRRPDLWDKVKKAWEQWPEH
ncbi:MAG: CYTH domain-containing protein [Candidatus Kerfeldbacteria bacterium]|nr:CYTH domain-containing protein [Candidatus Kerfeldbacteria bacterium]